MNVLYKGSAYTVVHDNVDDKTYTIHKLCDDTSHDQQTTDSNVVPYTHITCKDGDVFIGNNTGASYTVLYIDENTIWVEDESNCHLNTRTSEFLKNCTRMDTVK